MAAGKWIDELSTATPLEDAARRVLSVRLGVVRDYLALALREPEKDPEYIHQLRVGTRRACAALDIFSLCLPAKVYKSARKKMRQVRRAAGAARDWDVFLEMLRWFADQKDAAEPRGGLDMLIGCALGQRLAAQETLQNSMPDSFAVDRLSADVLHALRQPADGPATLLDLARPCLLQLLGKLDQAAGQDLDHIANLHQVRIVGKRLRYAMEIFASCFAKEFRKVHYAAVEDMQEILGRANDSHAACQRLELLRQKIQGIIPSDWPRFQPNFDELFSFHEQRLPRERQNFENWWRNWQDSGVKAALLELLSTAGKESD